MNKPTQQQLDDAREVIYWLIAFTERTEPYATEFINAGEMFAGGMPEAEDLTE